VFRPYYLTASETVCDWVNRLHSATVCGGLPVLNVAARDLYGATVRSVKGIFNSTTSYILDRMLAGEDQAQVWAPAIRGSVTVCVRQTALSGHVQHTEYGPCFVTTETEEEPA
jgi:hypothetical protein